MITPSIREARRFLRLIFRKNGYLRLPNPARRGSDSQNYKKGYEVRLVLDTKKELQDTRRVLQQSGFQTSSVFTKGRKFVQPIYGKSAVEAFCKLVREPMIAGSRAKTQAPNNSHKKDA